MRQSNIVLCTDTTATFKNSVLSLASALCLPLFSRGQSQCLSLQHDFEQSFLWWQRKMLSQTHLKKSLTAGEALLMSSSSYRSWPHRDRNASREEGQPQSHYTGNHYLFKEFYFRHQGPWNTIELISMELCFHYFETMLISIINILHVYM